MKKIIFLFLIASCIIGCSADDTIETPPAIVFNGNLVLKTQADVDAIGTQGYNVISGTLVIGDFFTGTNTPVPSDIVDLTPLSTITSVGRQIEIQSNPFLTSLDGLSNLRVTSGLIIRDNQNLTSLDGLTSLNRIDANPILTGQTFFSGGAIVLIDNPALTSIEALSNINPQVIHEVTIKNTGLASLEGLGNLTEIIRLQIINNDNLTSLTALEGLTSVENTVFIFGNDSLSDYCALQTSLQSNLDLTIYNVFDNQFNPTFQNIVDGDCVQ
ncbi:hypothetical protein C8N46_104107 [Kordia periserrulae]|uniref:Receptor L domain-containing protein n=1 Tax=Kordia periserrulae TaxID=701523 RepID=A0A2T6BZG2_9FLAO|nr:hypothetical protein [Kordia periserrulae]PTX61464.1 hypothetical protein C8N46_104107 [Kordia periserrulae]